MTRFTTKAVAGDGGWIVAVDVSDGSVTIRVPVGNLPGLEAVAKRALIDATDRCEWCGGRGSVDIGDSSQYMDEHYVKCDKCNGSGRLRKNVVPRAKCKHESFEVPGNKSATYCMAHCTNPVSSLNGKTCEDHLRRDCKEKEESGR